MTHPTPDAGLPTLQRATGKSPVLVVLVFAIWVGLLAVMGRHLVPLLLSARGVLEWISLLAFCGLLVAFWLLGSYYLALSAVFLWQRWRHAAPTERPDLLPEAPPPVAILYPTCDDFQREALRTCINQDYPCFHVFILDDSRQDVFRQEVDSFAAEFEEKVTVIRRPDRRGFKAGNLNHGLRIIGGDYPFFAVMDADEVIPPDFLRRTVACIEHGGHAFVQAGHIPNPLQPERFAKELGQTILPFWKLLLPVKNRYGCVACVGHGMLIRTSAWKAVGGFPEVASEDLAFTAVLLKQGLRGHYLADLICHEDFPSSLKAFKKQQERYTAGVFQVLCKFVPGLLVSRKATLIERLDFLLSCLPLYVPVFCCLFLLTSSVAMPLAYGNPSHLVADTALGLIEIPFLQTYDGRFSPLWGSSFVWLSVLLSIAPAFPMLTLAALGRIHRPWRLLVVSNIIYMATAIVTTGALLMYCIRDSIQFLPTGSKDKVQAHRRGTQLRTFGQSAEMLLALAMAAVLVVSFNFGLAVIALCPLLAVLGTARHCACINFTSTAAFLVVIAQMMLGAICTYAPKGLVPLVFSVHF